MNDEDRRVLKAIELRKAGMKIETIKACPHCRQLNIVPQGVKIPCWKCGKPLEE